VFKRLVVATFVSAVAFVGIAPAASAAPSKDVKAVKVVTPKSFKAIDWDAPTRRIDWD
jgi:hypothetical protein